MAKFQFNSFAQFPTLVAAVTAVVAWARHDGAGSTDASLRNFAQSSTYGDGFALGAVCCLIQRGKLDFNKGVEILGNRLMSPNPNNPAQRWTTEAIQDLLRQTLVGMRNLGCVFPAGVIPEEAHKADSTKAAPPKTTTVADGAVVDEKTDAKAPAKV